MQIYDMKTTELQGLSDHDDNVRSVAWLPEGKYLVSGSDDKSICICKMSDRTKIYGKVQTVIRGEDRGNYVRAVAFSSKEENLYLAAGGEEGMERWITRLEKRTVYLPSVLFSPTARYFIGNTVVTGMETGSVMVFCFSDKEPSRVS
ncbi:hypothetical protein RRF57_005591 [Xylaria bambusicola]|uniref:Uncharacterized protein n=1 Tax=Xylaria bambusicola TaxID=326684 RepID=A0AAN7UQR3_9PEZI